jgi:hypothetical protein
VERLPQAILALVVVLIPAIVIFLKRGRHLAWLLGGAILYLFLFNFRYGVLDGRTYSLSSVISADELLIYCALTALLALVIAWLAVVLGLKPFRWGPRGASQLVLSLTLVTAYLLLLPVLWSFVLNGTLVTWTLPDMTSMFLGFISLIQILVVAIVGLMLTGLSVLVAALVSARQRSRA